MDYIFEKNNEMDNKGKLYLIPVPIAEGEYSSLPAYVVDQIHDLQYFIVERARTSRRFISSTAYNGSISSLKFTELDKRNPGNFPEDLFDPIFKGYDIGLMSESGMPGIADPGALVVRKAHEKRIDVVPLIGPSSIFLALSASGLNGQQFCFHGYLPVKKPDLHQRIQKLDKTIQRTGQSQIFIETPYRNKTLIESILNICRVSTLLCIASEITGSNEYIKTKSITEWKKSGIPDLHKKTAVFILGR